MIKKAGIATLIIILLSFALWSFVWYRTKHENHFLSVTFFNVGQGDSSLIRFRDGEKMLVDCGPDKKVLQKLCKYLSTSDRTIDYMLITHFDLDHYGGCVDVLKRYDVKHIITNGYPKPSDSYWVSWNETAQKENADFKVINTRESWVIASTTLDFFSPNPHLILSPSEDTANNHSIVFRLADETQNVSILFSGDIEEPTEKQLIEEFCEPSKSKCPALQASVLKVAHHGSDTSSSKNFLEAVHPEKAIISVGKFNKFGHPSLRVIRRLERFPVQVLRTDINDDIILK